MKFKVGDKVKYVGGISEIKDYIGTIKYIDGKEYSVESEKENKKYFHQCSGHCKSFHGYWCKEDDIELIKKYQTVYDILSKPKTAIRIANLEHWYGFVNFLNEYNINNKDLYNHAIKIHTQAIKLCFNINEGNDLTYCDEEYYIRNGFTIYKFYDLFNRDNCAVYNIFNMVNNIKMSDELCMMYDNERPPLADCLKLENMKGITPNMRLLNIYKSKVEKAIKDKYLKNKEEIMAEDEVQKLKLEFINQVNVMLNRTEEDKFDFYMPYHTDITDKLLEENEDAEHKELDKLYQLIDEVEAHLELTNDYDKQMEILTKYGIVDKKTGKLKYE